MLERCLIVRPFTAREAGEDHPYAAVATRIAIEALQSETRDSTISRSGVERRPTSVGLLERLFNPILAIRSVICRFPRSDEFQVIETVLSNTLRHVFRGQPVPFRLPGRPARLAHFAMAKRGPFVAVEPGQRLYRTALGALASAIRIVHHGDVSSARRCRRGFEVRIGVSPDPVVV